MLKSITIILILTQSLYSQQSDLNTDEMIDIISTAQKAELTTHKQGLGSCSVTTLSKIDANAPTTEKVNVKFYFKGLATRLDVETPDALKQNSYSEVDTGEFWLRYNKLYDGAIVEQSRVKESNGRAFSKDFHPNAYYGYLGGITLPELLDKVRKRCDIKFNFTKEGLLEFTSKYGYDEDGSADPTATTSMYYILLDPAHSYRPLKWTYEQKNSVFQGEYQKEERTIKWPESSDSCYPTSVIHSQTTIRSPERIERMSIGGLRIPKSTTHKIHIEDINVNPNAPVSDETFTLEGMGVKSGTFVDDTITGISYRYGSSQEVSEALLEDMLESTSSPSIASENVKPSTYVSDKNIERVFDKAEQPDESAYLLKPTRIVLIILCGIAFLLFVFLLRFLVIRRTS